MLRVIKQIKELADNKKYDEAIDLYNKNRIDIENDLKNNFNISDVMRKICEIETINNQQTEE